MDLKEWLKKMCQLLETWIPRLVLFICLCGFLYGNIAGIINNGNYSFDKLFNAIYLLGSLALYLFLKECIVWCKAIIKFFKNIFNYMSSNLN